MKARLTLLVVTCCASDCSASPIDTAQDITVSFDSAHLETGKTIRPAGCRVLDAPSLESSSFGIDDAGVYRLGAGCAETPFIASSICGGDPASFRALGAGYARDSSRVFFLWDACKSDTDEVATSDPNTFEVMTCHGDALLARDATHYYWEGKVISSSEIRCIVNQTCPEVYGAKPNATHTERPPGCDVARAPYQRQDPPAPFFVRRGDVMAYTPQDADRPQDVWGVRSFDAATFQMTKWSQGFWARDKTNVYWFTAWHALPPATSVEDGEWFALNVLDPTTFEPLSEVYARDKRRIYAFAGCTGGLDDADPRTFEALRCPSLGESLGRDAAHYYLWGCIVSEFDLREALAGRAPDPRRRMQFP